MKIREEADDEANKLAKEGDVLIQLISGKSCGAIGK